MTVLFKVWLLTGTILFLKIGAYTDGTTLKGMYV
jgi:hypothetical protein